MRGYVISKILLLLQIGFTSIGESIKIGVIFFDVPKSLFGVYIGYSLHVSYVQSKAVSAIFSIIVLTKSNGYAKLERKYFRIFKKEFLEIIKYGLPIGFQRCMFSLSNVVVASTINSYGEKVMAANTIAHQFDAMVHDATDAFSMATMAFVAQNLGAKNFKRIWSKSKNQMAQRYFCKRQKNLRYFN